MSNNSHAKSGHREAVSGSGNVAISPYWGQSNATRHGADKMVKTDKLAIYALGSATAYASNPFNQGERS